MTHITNRRAVLSSGGLSVAGVLALAASATPAEARGRRSDPAQDANLLNAAIALEHEGIAAYEIALGSGLLPQPAVGLVRTFQGHHQQHRDDLARAVTRLGGRPAEAKTIQQYAADLNASSIMSLTDIQRLALRLERGAASAYLGLITPLHSTELHGLVARLAADEALHAAVFMADLHEPFPARSQIFA